MTDDELRALVRQAVERHLSGEPGAPSVRVPLYGTDASHARFLVATGSDTDGPCLIEPAVSCVHCGYCQSYGH